MLLAYCINLLQIVCFGKNIIQNGMLWQKCDSYCAVTKISEKRFKQTIYFCLTMNMTE